MQTSLVVVEEERKKSPVDATRPVYSIPSNPPRGQLPSTGPLVELQW
jgi:hypothetical protein